MSAASPGFSVIQGGRRPLDAGQSEAVQAAAGVIRRLSAQQAGNLVELIEEFQRDGYLARLRPTEAAILKLVAEVINGWDEIAIWELARTWASTLVARDDGFDWDSASLEEQDLHWLRVCEELRRRGLSQATLL